MKKTLAGILSIVLICTLAGCSKSNRPESENEPSREMQEAKDIMTTQAESKSTSIEVVAQISLKPKALVAYFSHSGNTESVANMIAEQTGGTIFKITPSVPYPDDYDSRVDIASEEQKNNARPELSTHVENMDDYDVIYLGFPNWWGTMPMVINTFLEEYDFSGKTIIPFCTHEGSGLGRSIDDIKALCPDSIVLDGLAVRGSSASTASDDVAMWVKIINEATE